MNNYAIHQTFKPGIAQEQTEKWVSQKGFTVKYFPTHQIMANASEELGEVARALNHMYGYKKKKGDEAVKNLKEEVGGFLFTLMCLTNSFDIKLFPLRHEYGGSPHESQWTRDPFKMNTFLVKALGDVAGKVLLLEQLKAGSDLEIDPKQVLDEIGCHVFEIIDIFEYILDFDLKEAFAIHMEKMNTRDKDRFKKKRKTLGNLGGLVE